jgi:hypothetical protein
VARGGAPAEAELAVIASRAAEETYAVIKERATTYQADVEGLLADRRILLAAVAERDGLIHDLLLDSEAFRLGREDMRREAVARLHEAAEGLAPLPNSGLAIADALLVMARLIEGGRPADPLPPSELRAENARLREALGRIAAGAAGPAGVVGVAQTLAECRAVAALALGEDARR